MIRIFGTYINEIWLIVGLEFFGGISFIIGYLIWNRYRFNVYICERYLDTWKVKKKLKAKMTDIEIKWKDFGYIIDFTSAFIDSKNKPVLYYNFRGAKPIKLLTGMQIKEDSETFRIAMDGKIMRHMASKRMEKWYTYIILGLVVGMIVIGVYAMYNQQEMSFEIARLTDRMINMTLRNQNVVVVP